MRNFQKLAIVSYILSALALTAYSQEQLQLVIEIARHGARSPVAVLPLNSTSVNFNDTLALLSKGWVQHQSRGQSLRQRLVTNLGFLSTDYNPSQVFVQATSSSRTQWSAQAQLSGLFPDQAWYHPFLVGSPGTKTQGYTIYNASSSSNWATRLTDSNCPFYGAALSDVSNSASYVAARQYWYNTYKSDLQTVTGFPIKNNITFDEICEYLYFSQFTDIKLNFTPSAKTRAYCMAFEDGYMYQTDYGVEREWKTLAYEWLNQLSEISSLLLGQKNSTTQLPTFNKYFSQANKNQTTLPKFILYTTHDEIIGAYFEALNRHDEAVQGMQPAGAIMLEFFLDTADNTRKVRTYVNRTQVNANDATTNLNLNGSSTNVLTLTQFMNFINYRIGQTGITNLTTTCSSTYVSNGVYYDNQTNIAEITALYQKDLNSQSGFLPSSASYLVSSFITIALFMSIY